MCLTMGRQNMEGKGKRQANDPGMETDQCSGNEGPSSGVLVKSRGRGTLGHVPRHLSPPAQSPLKVPLLGNVWKRVQKNTVSVRDSRSTNVFLQEPALEEVMADFRCSEKHPIRLNKAVAIISTFFFFAPN